MSGLFPTKKSRQQDHDASAGPRPLPAERMLALLSLASKDGPATSGVGIQFTPGKLLRSDQLPVDETLAGIREMTGCTPDDDRGLHALHERTASVSDLTPALYQSFSATAGSIMNWFPALAQAVHTSQAEFTLPATSIWRMPHELAQYLRLDYGQTNAASRELFDALCVKHLALDTQGTSRTDSGDKQTRAYFLKTGEFSSKFEFANALCTEAHEAGQYFHVVNNLAMMLGAGTNVDLCAREYIDPEPGTPTIYNGMPLRTELRAFVDLGQDLGTQLAPGDSHGPQPEILGITPYWHPSVMDRALVRHSQLGLTDVANDYRTWLEHKDTLTAGFNQYRDPVLEQLALLLPALRAAGLRGAWSVDVMVTSGKLYVIDMALMATSALAELLKVTEEYATPAATPARLDRLTEELIWSTTEQALFTVPPGHSGTIPGVAQWSGLGIADDDSERAEGLDQPSSAIWSGPSVTYQYQWPASQSHILGF